MLHLQERRWSHLDAQGTLQLLLGRSRFIVMSDHLRLMWCGL